VGHFLYAVDGADVVECVDRRRETSVKAENLSHVSVRRSSHRGPDDRSHKIGLHNRRGKGGEMHVVEVCEKESRTWFSMRAVRGRKSNRSVKNRQTLAFPYLRRHSS
jgi:hypothetical protein